MDDHPMYEQSYCYNVLLSYKASRKHYGKPTWMMKTHKSLVWMTHYIPPFPNGSVGLKRKKTIEKQGVKKPWLKTWFQFQFQIQTQF